MKKRSTKLRKPRSRAKAKSKTIKRVTIKDLNGDILLSFSSDILGAVEIIGSRQ